MNAPAQLHLDLAAPSHLASDAALTAIADLARSLASQRTVWAPVPWIESDAAPFRARCETLDEGVRRALAKTWASVEANVRAWVGADRVGPIADLWRVYCAPPRDGVVQCDVRPFAWRLPTGRVSTVTRVDLRVRGVQYLGAALGSCGGPLRDLDVEDVHAIMEDRVRAEHEARGTEREAWGCAVYVVRTAREKAYFVVRAAEIEVLRVCDQGHAEENRKA